MKEDEDFLEKLLRPVGTILVAEYLGQIILMWYATPHMPKGDLE